ETAAKGQHCYLLLRNVNGYCFLKLVGGFHARTSKVCGCRSNCGRRLRVLAQLDRPIRCGSVSRLQAPSASAPDRLLECAQSGASRVSTGKLIARAALADRFRLSVRRGSQGGLANETEPAA